MLLSIDFHTLFDYLHFMRSICTIMSTMNEKCIVFLPAAVSDFFIPWKEMFEHKIQSRDVNSLTLTFENTPKMLKPLVLNWCPRGFVVSFKLETEAQMLREKSLASISSYHVHMVVGNMLQSHLKDVVLFLPDGSEIHHTNSPDNDNIVETLENDIVDSIIEHHTRHMRVASQSGAATL